MWQLLQLGSLAAAASPSGVKSCVLWQSVQPKAAWLAVTYARLSPPWGP